MTAKTIHLRLGLLACAISLFLIFFAIPHWVSSPSNVGKVILSPLFWPYTLSALTGLVGILLFIEWWRTPPTDERINEPSDDTRTAMLRLLGMAVIMVLTMMLLPVLGMVWTCMLSFISTAFLVRTRHPVTAVICAVVIPLLLYVFFAHVAGVAIPQGDFVRLP